MDSVGLLGRALDQTGDLLDQVRPAVLTAATPCAAWDVAALADHLCAAPGHMLAMVRGESPDFSSTPHLSEGWGMAFRRAGDDLVHACHELQEHGEVSVEWHLAELAVHDWDLATALAMPVRHLDDRVAEVGFDFMRANLTPERRGSAFGPEQPAGEGAGPYQRIAAYAGRHVLGGADLA